MIVWISLIGFSVRTQKKFGPKQWLGKVVGRDSIGSPTIEFFSSKYKTQKYLAYFQAFTNTYAPLADLRKMYEEALAHEDVIGLVIATRPDCIKDEVLDYLEELVTCVHIIQLKLLTAMRVGQKQKKIDINIPKLDDFIHKSSFVNGDKITIDGLRVNFQDGWGLLRASNTTPKLVLRFEAQTSERLDEIQQLFLDQLKQIDESIEIKLS